MGRGGGVTSKRESRISSRGSLTRRSPEQGKKVIRKNCQRGREVERGQCKKEMRTKRKNIQGRI